MNELTKAFNDLNENQSKLENDFLLKNGDTIPIRKDTASDIKQTYSDYFFQKMRNNI